MTKEQRIEQLRLQADWLENPFDVQLNGLKEGWIDCNYPDWKEHCIYRRKPAKKRVPLTADDIKPGCVVRLRGQDNWCMVQIVNRSGIYWGLCVKGYDYSEMAKELEYKNPGMPSFAPCWKEVEE